MSIPSFSTPDSDLLVLLYYRPLGMIRGRTISISSNSVFIDTNFVRLNKDEELDIAILYPNGFIRRMNCIVESSSKFGTTLNFAEPQSLLPDSNYLAASQVA